MLILSQHLWRLSCLLGASATRRVLESHGRNARTRKDNAERRENESGGDNSSAKRAINQGSKYWRCKPSGGIIQNDMALLSVYHSGLNRCRSTSNKVFVNRLSDYIPASLVGRSPMSVPPGNEESLLRSSELWDYFINVCERVQYPVCTRPPTLMCFGCVGILGFTHHSHW